MNNYTLNNCIYLSTKEALKAGYQFSAFHAITPGVINGINTNGENDLFFPKEMLDTYTNDKVPLKGNPFEMVTTLLKGEDGKTEKF
jgi:hypothetical protein